MTARFIRRRLSKIVWVPAIALFRFPTRAEISGGTILANPGVSTTAAVCGLSGFAVEATPLPYPSLADTFEVEVPRLPRVAGGPCSLTFYDDRDTHAAIRNTLAANELGNMVLFPYGDIALRRCEVWPVRSLGAYDLGWSLEEPAKFRVPFAVLRRPILNAVVPAA